MPLLKSFLSLILACGSFANPGMDGNLESFRTDQPGREWDMQRRVKIK
jgi:hypothetical protein